MFGEVGEEKILELQMYVECPAFQLRFLRSVGFENYFHSSSHRSDFTFISHLESKLILQTSSSSSVGRLS